MGSIYWYVASKDELLDRASDHVLAGVLAATERHTGAADPIDGLRAMAIELFAALEDRPWLAGYFLRDTGTQPNGIALYERLGEQVMRLDLTPKQAFQAVSSILGFVIGIAADLGQKPPPDRDGSGGAGRDESMEQHVEQWRQLPPDEFPFVHHVLEEFASHDDFEQFRAGLDLLLAGLRLQGGGSSTR